MKNLYYIYILALVLSGITAHAQLPFGGNDVFLIPQNDKEWKGLTRLNTDYSINSSSISNFFSKKLLYQGGYISNEDKSNVTDRLKNRNRFGLDLNAGLQGLAKINNFYLGGGISYREHLHAGFTQDFFKLVFEGNKQFAGKTAELSPLKINYFDYIKFNVLGFKEINNLKIGAGLSYLRGGNYNSLLINRGALFTEQNGSYLDLDLDLRLAFSERESGLIPSSNGHGMAADLYFTYNLNNNYINVQVNDLGFINWKGLTVVEIDSSYHYSGKAIDDILTLDESVFTDLSADSLSEEFRVKKQTKGLTYFIPGNVHINYVATISEKLKIVAGANYYLSAAHIPKIYIKSVHNLSESFIVIPCIAYGGYGKADFELGAAKSFKNKLVVSANAFYLEYLAIPKKSSGHGVNFAITKLF
ncbi:MAG TPA: DUF5723 family protein [Cytophagaceae bacterium]